MSTVYMDLMFMLRELVESLLADGHIIYVITYNWHF